MNKGNLNLLSEIDDVKILVRYLGLSWMSEELVMEYNGEIRRFTLGMGEYELGLGEYCIYGQPCSQEALNIQNKVLEEIADKTSFRIYDEGKYSQLLFFNLNEKYIKILEAIDDVTPTRI